MTGQPTPARMEAFSDGVIAVIITIMVLELKVPRLDGWVGFRSVLPALGVYALSFTLTGIYWVNHHYLIERLKSVDGLVLWMNLTLLFALSLLPFFTNYVAEKHFDGFSAGLYSASLLFSAISYQLLTMAVGRAVRRQPGERVLLDRQQVRMENVKGVFSILMCVLAIVLARFAPRLAMVPAVVVAAVWIVPNFGTVRRAG